MSFCTRCRPSTTGNHYCAFWDFDFRFRFWWQLYWKWLYGGKSLVNIQTHALGSAVSGWVLYVYCYYFYSIMNNFQPCNGVLTKSPSEFSLVLSHAWLEALLLTLKYNISIWNIKLNNFQAIKCRNKNFMATEQHLWLANAPVTSVMDFIQTFILMKIGWTLKCSDAWKKRSSLERGRLSTTCHFHSFLTNVSFTCILPHLSLYECVWIVRMLMRWANSSPFP